jgi:hypothetical protein
LALLSDVREKTQKIAKMSDGKVYGMMDYSFCPITRKCCVERKCAWWLDISGEGGCALRCLGALVSMENFFNEYKETLKLVMSKKLHRI